jgi:Hydantoin racemase
MKIAVVIPNTTMSPDTMAQRQAFLEANAAPDVELVLWRNDTGPASIESEAERDEAGTEILRNLAGRDLSGIDAVIPWCAADPGVLALRQALPCAVVGPLVSACHVASLVGERFALVMPAGSRKLNRMRIEAYGFGPRLNSVRQVDTPVLELRADLDRTLERLAEEVAAAERDGADSVVLGCMALFGLAPRISANIPVIDPALAALNMATATVRMGLTNTIRN